MVNFIEINERIYNVASIDTIVRDAVDNSAIIIIDGQRINTDTSIDKVLDALKTMDDICISTIPSGKDK